MRGGHETGVKNAAFLCVIPAPRFNLHSNWFRLHFLCSAASRRRAPCLYPSLHHPAATLLCPWLVHHDISFSFPVTLSYC